MDRFNIVQETTGISYGGLWQIIDGQRLPGGYPEPGARVMKSGLSYDAAKSEAKRLSDGLLYTGGVNDLRALLGKLGRRDFRQLGYAQQLREYRRTLCTTQLESGPCPTR